MISIIWILLYILVALIVVPLVRILGPVGITSYTLEEYYDSDNGFYNVAYRIIAPVLCCSTLISIVGIIACAAGAKPPTACYLSVLLYWIIICVIKITKKTILSKMAFAFQAIFSIGIALLLDIYVIPSLVARDFRIIDNSNIAFQAEMAILTFFIQIIASIITRRRYALRFVTPPVSTKYSTSYSSLINTSEEKLYEYERMYGSLLPKRFSDDPLLRCVFFTIMAIEDSNRPRSFRILERVACRAGFAKTTGIMQQKSDKPLSDIESVELSIPYIEHMWDMYLRALAKSSQGEYSSTTLSFTGKYYIYDYNIVSALLDQSFSYLYGDYCGTRLLNANNVFLRVRQFQERREYGFTPCKVMGESRLFPVQTSWFSDALVYWSDTYTLSRVNHSDRSSEFTFVKLESSNIDATTAHVAELCHEVQSHCDVVQEVTLAENIYAAVVIRCRTEHITYYGDSIWERDM